MPSRLEALVRFRLASLRLAGQLWVQGGFVVQGGFRQNFKGILDVQVRLYANVAYYAIFLIAQSRKWGGGAIA